MTPPEFAVSVVIPVRNEGARLHRAVHSMVAGRSRAFPLEVVVIDDASTDGACDRLGAAGFHRAQNVSLEVRRLAEWSGIPYARNRGAEAARHPILFITDGNVIFPDAWDLPIRREFRRGRALCATIADTASPFKGHGCRLLVPSMGVTWIPHPGAYGGFVPIMPCAGTIIDRALFHALGGYDETLPIYGAAECELSVRLWLSGYEIVNVPDLSIAHWFRPKAEHEAFTSSIGPTLLKNYLRFGFMYLPEPLILQMLRYYAHAGSADIDACLRDLHESDVWDRRAQLAGKLRHDFTWFVQRFGLLDQSGEAVA